MFSVLKEIYPSPRVFFRYMRLNYGVNKPVAFVLYPVWLCVLTAFLIMLAIVLLWFLAALAEASAKAKRYPRDRYRKVVKEGLLWDTVEWHER